MSSNNHNEHPQKEIDPHSKVETTGHEWDGIKELNNPAPRWWLWVFFITFIWAVGYWVVYPAWPTLSGEGERGGTTGNKGWTQYTQLHEQQQEIIQRRAKYLTDFSHSSFEEIYNNPELYAFALAGGRSAFKDNCATCHGSGGAGAKGYPNLNDDDWLWGGTVNEIHHTIAYGIRSNHDNTRFSQMPSFAGMLTDHQIQEIATHVLGLTDDSIASSEGARLYKDNCASCHGNTGKGDKSQGAPNLADAIWFYSDGNKASIASQIKNPKHGMMPAWDDRLDEQTIRQLSIYVHSLGGGK